jgi:dTDP-4-amino-4,6-dideoxygalactose transaminase
VKVPFVDLHRQYLSIKDEIDAAIQAVIDDSAFVGARNNKYVTKFEEEWAEYLGAKHVVGCGNGTDALEMILEAMEIGSGDEVIVPAMTWISTAGAVARVGATPVFVDIHPQYYTIDPALIEEAITEKTKAIIPVHLYGLPAEMDEILNIARRHNLKVIEDAAQAHGAEYKGKKAGTLADAAIFSFYPGKNLGAFGDAGCVVTHDEGLAEEVRRIGNHGQTRKHDFRRVGRNSRLDGLQAAVLRIKLRQLDSWTASRRRLAQRYLESPDVRRAAQREVPGGRHAYHLFVIVDDAASDIRLAFKESNVSSGHHYPTVLPSLPFVGRSHGAWPVAEGIARLGVSVPLFPEMLSEESDVVVRTLSTILAGRSKA